jgi:carotenoid cleavage dioxygenase
MDRDAARPFHLRDNFAPVDHEASAIDLPVEGAIPRALRGLYLRNGPNPRQPSSHWFAGDGMVHGVRIEDGPLRLVPQSVGADARPSPRAHP